MNLKFATNIYLLELFGHIMSKGKLLKYLEKTKPVDTPSSYRLQKKPVLLSDSKGKYLRDCAVTEVEKEILWLCKGGATTSNSYYWFVPKAEQTFQTYGYFELYVWLGTCDLTVKNKTYISLNHNYSESNIISIFEEFINLGKKLALA